MEKEIVLFETKDREVKLSVPIEGDTVWLTQDQMSELFDTARSSIAYHIGNILKKVNCPEILLSKFSTEVKAMLQDRLNIITLM